MAYIDQVCEDEINGCVIEPTKKRVIHSYCHIDVEKIKNKQINYYNSDHIYRK